MKKSAKPLLFISLLLLSPLASLVSCGDSISATTNIKLESNLVELEANESKTIKGEGVNSNTKFKLEVGSIVSVNIKENEVTLVASQNGIEKIKFYNENENQSFNLIVVVKDKENITELEVASETKKTYALDESFYYSDAIINLVTKDEDGNVINLVELDPNNLYFSLANGYTFDESGTIKVLVTAFEGGKYTTWYDVTVLDDSLSLIKRNLSKLRETKEYEITYKATMNSFLTIDGDTIFNPNYYINNYSEQYFAKDKNGVFKFDYTLDDSGKKNGITTQNGYFTLEGEKTSDLENVVEIFSSATGISEFSDDYLSLAKKDGDVYVFNDAKLLSLFWNKTLVLNGSAKELAIAPVGDAISFRLVGNLTNGTELAFRGSIINIGNAKEAFIEDFLANNSRVTTNPSSELSDLFSLIDSGNYTLSSGDLNILVDKSYIFIEEDKENGSGIIEKDGKLYNFILENGTLTLTSEISDYKEVEKASYYLSNYTPFKVDTIGSYYYTTYYGGYTIFDTTLRNDYWLFTQSEANAKPFVFTLAIEEGTVTVYEYYYSSRGSLRGMSSVIKNFGITNNAHIESFLVS